MKLLVVEDDTKTVQSLQKGLTEEGFVVDVCRDGETGLHLALNAVHDLIILDVMLPAMDGWALLAHARESQCDTPILVLTAKEAVEDRVKGLDLGADDYLIKPFAFVELVARIRSILRRHATPDAGPLCFADLTVDLRRHRVVRNKVPINLSFKEIQLLELLVRYQGEVLSRMTIAESVWDMNFDYDSNVIDVNVRRLRAKVDDPFSRKLIHTVRGRGYVLR
jgi:two-component system, OmpR family, copper resistance phosphate regulon response regulator CusR